MPGSFSSALSALSAMATAVDVVGNNLANLNTPGFKNSTVSFRDLVTQSMGSGLGETQVGFGTAQPLTFRQFTQGSVQTSGGLLDAAIQGDGFFVLKDNGGKTVYSRAGNFLTDKDGNLLTNTGLHVQGWTAINPVTREVDTVGAIGNIVVPVGTLKTPTVTSRFSVDMNLDSTAVADATSFTSAPMTVYDSLGSSHSLKLNFQKTGVNQWSYRITIPGEEVSGGTAGTPFEITNGALTFDSGGRLTVPAADSPVEFDITGFADGAGDQHLIWDPYTAAGIARITQFGQPSALSASSQNGSGAAQLIRVGLANGGGILAQYSNGDQVVVAQLALASIRNPDSLLAVGDNNFALSARSAIPAVGTPGTGGRGSIVGGALEASTVDIAHEFTNLIVYQRGYQANARVVTAQDQLSQDTINLIR
ncbi:MAG TPA: flagellar hook protein FlgE [Bryobacteraceae bacterium]|nr:flagellar hook protein FlgE [Bryobacteraceae bacterium]